MKRSKYILMLLILLIPLPVFAGRGCCSWHGGQYGCDKNGRVVCMDGTYSPSCTCWATNKKKKKSTTKRKTANFDSLNKTSKKTYSYTSTSSYKKKSSTKTTKKKETKKAKKKTTTKKVVTTTSINNSLKTSAKDSTNNSGITAGLGIIATMICGLIVLGIKLEHQ